VGGASSDVLKGLKLGNDPSWGLYPDCRIDGGNDEKGTLAGGEEVSHGIASPI